MSLPDLVIHPLVVRTVRVRCVETLPGRVRRIRLEGDELSPFTRAGLEHPAFAAPGFDDHIKVVLAADGDIASALPAQHPDGIEWTPSKHRLTRDYTPHSVDPDGGGFSLDFVLHGDGPAARWATEARPGAELSFVGPKSSTVLPADATSVLLIGDETALPAIGRFLAERPLAVPAHTLLLTGDRAAGRDLSRGAGDSLRVEFMNEPDGEAIAELYDAMCDEHDLGDRPFVWAAGEAKALLPLRRRLSGKVARGYRSITGYWHVDDDHPATVEEPGLPPSPVAWFAVRAAIELGLLPALSTGTRSTRELETELGTGAALSPLLDTLAATGILRSGKGGRWELTDLAADLLDDPHEREGFIGPEAEQTLALRHLAASLRTGQPAWALTYGVGFAESVRDDDDLVEHLAHESESLVYLQHGLVRVLAGLESADTVVVGPGAELVAGLAAKNGMAGVRTVSAGQSADVVVSAMLLGHLDDDAARAHLRSLAAMAPRALVVDASAPDGLSRGAAELGLLRFATTATPARSTGRLGELARECGWTPVSHRGLGWGVVADEFAFNADTPPVS